MVFTKRQEEIIKIVKKCCPITGDDIAKRLSLTRSALRTDFSVLTKRGVLKSKTRVGYVYQGFTPKKLIHEIMTAPITLDEGTSVHDAILELFLKDVGSIFVTEEEKLIGIISRKDLLKAAIGNNDIAKIPISVVMTRMPNIIFCTEDEEILSAAEKLIKYKVDCLPVVRIEGSKETESLTVVGRITKTSITSLFLEFFNK